MFWIIQEELDRLIWLKMRSKEGYGGISRPLTGMQVHIFDGDQADHEQGYWVVCLARRKEHTASTLDIVMSTNR